MGETAFASGELETTLPERTKPRYGLAAATALHGIVFGVAALKLPWKAVSWATVVFGVLAATHGALAVASALGRERWVRTLWMALSFASLVVWGVPSLLLASAGAYLSALYQGLGSVLALGLFVLSAVLALFTLPIALWGLTVTRPFAGRPRLTWGSAGGALLLASTFVGLAGFSGRVTPVTAWEDGGPEELWRRVTEKLPKQSHATPPTRLRARSTTCSEPAHGPRLTALLSSLDKDGTWTTRCLQAETQAALEQSLLDALSREGHAAIADFVTARHELSLMHPLLDGFKLRPARDGICAARSCLSPWQLVALDSFTSQMPLATIPDVRFGFSAEALRRALGVEATDPLTRIETETFLWSGGRSERLSRLRPLHQKPDADSVRRAVRAAERHIVTAQAPDGRFRYTLNPFTGKADTHALNLPRQAGTTLALCELGTSAKSKKTVQKSLALLAEHELRLGPLSALSTGSTTLGLGQTALPLSALLTCRPQTGTAHDELIGRLTEFLLAMQRENGSFFSIYKLSTRSPQGNHESLYAAGQAVLALVLLEQQLQDSAFGPELTKERVAQAIDRAMDHYARNYWPWVLRDFFYLEENWHCLAARAALSSHRHTSYEKFCLDYVAFKSRLVQRSGEGPPDLVGGYGVTPVFEPHNTATAGFGEALAAAIAIQRARGDDPTDHLTLMRDVLGFLQRAQWDRPSCFACAKSQRVLGGFSEHAGSPVIRIDYVQHALAALGHGGNELFGGS